MDASRKRHAFKEAKKSTSEKKVQPPKDENESESSETEMQEDLLTDNEIELDIVEVIIPLYLIASSQPIYLGLCYPLIPSVCLW